MLEQRVSAYAIRWQDMEVWLRRRYKQNIEVQIINDDYVFTVPTPLTKDDYEEIVCLREDHRALRKLPSAQEIISEPKPQSEPELKPPTSFHAGVSGLRRADDAEPTGSVMKFMKPPTVSMDLWRMKQKGFKLEGITTVQDIIKVIDEGTKSELPGLRDAFRHICGEHVFIIDDSKSMAPEWGDVVEVFQALTYILKAAGKDVITLFFSSDHTKEHRSTHPNSLVELVKGRRLPPGLMGTCDMAECLKDVMREVVSSRFPPRAKEIFPTVSITGPTRIYILTNGVWRHPDRRWAWEVDEINELCNELEDLSLAIPVALEFIHFGLHHTNLSGLEQLDRFLATPGNFSRDLIDITWHRGSVWKMLLGSLSEGLGDNRSSPGRSVEITQGSSSSRPLDHGGSESVIATDSGYVSGLSQTTKGQRVARHDSLPPPSVITEIETEEPGGSDSQPSEGQSDFTDAQSVGPQWITAYITEFSRELLRGFHPEYMDEPTMRHLDAVLPGILKEFSLKIGLDPPTHRHGEIGYFVRKYRNIISQRFQEAHLHANEDARDSQRDPVMSLADKLSAWQLNTSMGDMEADIVPGSLHIREVNYLSLDNDYTSIALGTNMARGSPPTSDGSHLDLDSEDDEDIEMNETGFQQYRECLANSEIYKWLLDTLKKQALLVTEVPDVKGQIRRKILSSLPQHKSKVSRKLPSPSYTVEFQTDWDPAFFVKEQKYNISPAEAIASTVTITGSDLDAQALTATQYLRQTWSSLAMIRVIQEILRRGQMKECQATLADQTKLAAWYSGAMLHVRVEGSAPSIADIGEQVAWLGAALRPSPIDEQYTGAWYCFPSVSCLKIPSQDTQYFEIKFRFEIVEPEPSNGNCWHNMFRNPVIVRGYPIARRAEANTGLEVHLDTLVQLMRTKRVTIFDDKFFIKGFSSMLSLTERKGGMFLWHLLYNSKGSRIPYLEYKDKPSENFTVSQLETSRHVVGWCSKVRIVAGSKDGAYDIRRTSLLKPGSQFVFEKISITGGRFVTIGATIAIGVRETPLHYPRQNYISMLDWLSKKYVILWDDGTQRGWLVNGPTALLHLVRASLKQDINGQLGHVYVFKETDIQDPEDKGLHDTAYYALNVLAREENRNIRIHPDKTESWEETSGDEPGKVVRKSKTSFVTLEDRVEDFYHLLEKMMDHETGIKSRSGVNVKPRLRKHLEGWEFRDLSLRRDRIYPVVKTLPPVAKGWVDFARDIDAITLFGRGFGEIIQPAWPDTMCDAWSELPSGKHYLAATVLDLKDIMDLDDNTTRIPLPNVLRISDALVWHAPGQLFDPCQCHGLQHFALPVKHSDFAQVLFPSSLKKMLRNRVTSARLQDHLHGAIVFGNSSIFKWYWKDYGDPEKGLPPPEAVELEVLDSRTGSSPYSTGLNSLVAVTDTDETSIAVDLPLGAGSSAQTHILRPEESLANPEDTRLPEPCKNVMPTEPDPEVGGSQKKRGFKTPHPMKSLRKWFGRD